ncbi:dihydroorotate dehydrogenase-like protein [Marinilabiliaceae bacterium ANBcel2]|nr:dihydroorotate dehydrogenase-like protein [Marinilabiliaceae bacterium ANBcel2]
MADISVKYLGLDLSSPVIAASSGLTNSVDNIKKLEKAGVGAVVLKSLFEEQINFEVNEQIAVSAHKDYPEAYDYMTEYAQNNSVNEYLKLISGAKNEVNIPVIASINCYSDKSWVNFAKKIEEAGADGIELNLFIVNHDKNSDPQKYEEVYYKVSQSVSKVVSIPVSIKLGVYFSNLVSLVNKLSVSGSKGVVLFNRFYEPDINIDKLTLTSSNVYSSPSDIRRSLRWVAIVSDKIPNIDISASTGVHDGEAVVKQLLAGAKAVQVCSVIYKHGPAVITSMNNYIKEWMKGKNFSSIDDFNGIMSYSRIPDPAMYERAQFMKYFSQLDIGDNNKL